MTIGAGGQASESIAREACRGRGPEALDFHHRLGGHPRRAARRQARVRRRVRQQLHDLRQRLRDRPERAEQHVPAAGRVRRADRLPRQERHGLARRSRRSTSRSPTCPSCRTSSRRSARSPRPTPATVSKDGTIAYASVGWNVNPDSLDTSYLDKLNNAVAPATKAGLQVEYGAGAGRDRPADQRPDVRGHRPGLRAGAAADHVRLADRGRASRWWRRSSASLSGLALLGLLAAAGHVPDHRPDHRHAARARGRRRLRALPGGQAPGAAGQRHGRRSARCGAPRERPGPRSWWPAAPSRSRSWACTSPEWASSASLGLAAAIVVVVTMISALTLVPAFMGLVRESDPGRYRAGPRPQGGADRAAAGRGRPPRPRTSSTSTARSPGGGGWSSDRPWPWGMPSVAVLVVLAIPLFSITLGQPDNGTNPTSESNRQAYDLISQGFGVGVNGPLTVVVKLPKQSSSANSSLLTTMQSDICQDRRRRVGHPGGGQLGRHHRGVQRHPDHPAAGRADHRPGRTRCAMTCCPRSTRPATSPARPPARSTSPTRSPAGWRG